MDISRRNFLKLGAAGTAAAGLAGLTGCAPSAPSAAASSNDLPVTGVEDWLGSAPELSPDDCARTLECDVLVVGSALSGSMAAYGAMRNGAAVTVIERNAAPHIGGMTISFLNSQTQLEAGLPKYDPVETANAMFNLTQYRSDMRLNAVWCERSGEVLDNLRADFLEPYHQYYMPMSLEGIFPEPSQEITAYISTGVAFSETDILTDFTHNIHQFLEDKGVEVIERTGTSVDEIALAAQALVSDGVEAVFTPTDNTVMKSELTIYETLMDAGIPHYTGADSFALNGAFLGYGVDYANLGVETANMIADILLNVWFAAAVLVFFSCPGSTAHTDIFYGSAEAGHFMAFKMGQADKYIGIHNSTADLGFFYIFPAFYRHIYIICTFQAIANKDGTSYSQRCKSIFPCTFQML